MTSTPTPDRKKCLYHLCHQPCCHFNNPDSNRDPGMDLTANSGGRLSANELKIVAMTQRRYSADTDDLETRPLSTAQRVSLIQGAKPCTELEPGALVPLPCMRPFPWPCRK